MTAGRRKLSGGALHSRKVAPYVFVSPFIITFLMFQMYPIISSFIMSFQEIVPGDTKFIGVQNYSKLVQDQHFYTAVWNSMRYTFWTLLILLPVPLVLAVFLNSTKMVAKNFFRSTLFIPALTSIVVGGAIFRLIFGELENAPMNVLLSLFGYEPVKWTSGAGTGMFLMVALASWRWMGVNIIYFLSGLQSIPNELYEAADMDGANAFTKFFNITIPLLKPVTVYVLTISIFGGFHMFTESYVFWGTKSPSDIGLTIVGYLYQQSFEFFDMGYGSAIGVAFLVLVLAINLLQLFVSGQFRKEA
ncbi:carbohydrate ABC transporter permease [Paenibacillus xerothermodurans]|uniref:Sugar ABC transporter permease n=1 Tax=Paenibacillus xerothermodurans TaxID=1977292 RepID=A0A2W1N8U5_PAEXE|nr:sugar ABC transporter permease [Paenibacillus xerothermodurans]PZE20080.1 sugar ABC transporter permease [Paenibacillus xerothermodurans]